MEYERRPKRLRAGPHVDHTEGQDQRHLFKHDTYFQSSSEMPDSIKSIYQDWLHGGNHRIVDPLDKRFDRLYDWIFVNINKDDPPVKKGYLLNSLNAAQRAKDREQKTHFLSALNERRRVADGSSDKLEAKKMTAKNDLRDASEFAEDIGRSMESMRLSMIAQSI